MLLDGIRRIARGEAIAAGVPEERMPVVNVREPESTPATVNTDPLTEQISTRFRTYFGEERVKQIRPVMAGEDFGRFRLAEPKLQSLIFWVGGVPKDKYDAAVAAKDMSKLPRSTARSGHRTRTRSSPPPPRRWWWLPWGSWRSNKTKRTSLRAKRSNPAPQSWEMGLLRRWRSSQ
jgi:metal-dependent amidase/aminoacylase/carboxypeptidase family protein